MWADGYSASPSPRGEELECNVVRVSKGQCRVPGHVHDATVGDAEVRLDGFPMLSTHRGWHSRMPDDRAPAGAR